MVGKWRGHVEQRLLYPVVTIKVYIDGLIRKLCNSKISQDWGFWFVGSNSDSPSSSLEVHCLKEKREFLFLIKIITDLDLFRW